MSSKLITDIIAINNIDWLENDSNSQMMGDTHQCLVCFFGQYNIDSINMNGVFYLIGIESNWGSGARD